MRVKAFAQYFHVVLFFFFLMLYKVVLTFRSVDETLVCDNILLCGTVFYAVQGGSNLYHLSGIYACGRNPYSVTIQKKAIHH